MKYAVTILVLMMLLLTTGCVPYSLYAIYTDDTLIFEPALLGSWANADQSTTYSFISNGKDGYSLIITNDVDGTAYYEAYLADIGGRVFLDIYPDIKVLGDGDYGKHVVLLHSFYVIEQFEPTLRVLPIDTDWLSEYLENESEGIVYEIIEGNLSLVVVKGPPDVFSALRKMAFVARTEDMQAFLLGIPEDEIVFYETEEMEPITLDQ